MSVPHSFTLQYYCFVSFSDNDLLLGRADSQFGVFTGGCGHYMHAECWTRYVYRYPGLLKYRYLF